MAISELKEIICDNCGKRGFRARVKIENEMIITKEDNLTERVIWYSLCEYCGKTKKIIWSQES